MKTLLVVSLALVGLAGCSALSSKSSSQSLVTDVTMGVACYGEVQAAAPACIAEVPSCVSLGKVVAGQVKGK